MHYTQDEYKNTMWTFLNDHHGQIIKLKDNNGKIFSYVIRCQAEKENKNLLIFMVSFDLFYLNIRNGYEPNSKEFKYYAIKRALEKWKNVKKDDYIKFGDCNEEFLQRIRTDIEYVSNMYAELKIERPFDVDQTAEYVFKVLKSIKNYYKNEDTSNFSLILL